MLFLELLYLISAALLAAYGLNSLLHALLFLKWRKERPSYPHFSEDDLSNVNLPRVTVQLPVYNERYVVERLITAVMKLTWLPGHLQVQVLDDSTDETTPIIANILKQYGDGEIQIEHIRRQKRTHYKAGALQEGLKTAVGQYIVIFDADFVPPPDFLLRTIPLFQLKTGSQKAGGPIGCVQTRWGHLNTETSMLTRAQALGADGHFVVEQRVRNSIGAFLNFNGTAGIWDRKCLEAVGGWQGDTLTEDLDLSYRAQLAGWRIVYQPEVVVPAELPVQAAGFKRQQFRWAKGSIQTAKKLLGKLWRADEPLWRKVLGTIHLTNYAIHPLMVLNLLLTLPMALSMSPWLVLAPFFMMTAIGPPLMYWLAMKEDGSIVSTRNRLGRLSMLVALGVGLSLNNTRAVLEAILGVESAFNRTPKFAITDKVSSWRSSPYALTRDMTTLWEAILMVYSFFLIGWSALHSMWWLIGWLALYAAGYGSLVYLSLSQSARISSEPGQAKKNRQARSSKPVEVGD